MIARIFGMIQLTRGSTTLNGYVMEDNTFQFIISGKIASYPSLLAVWDAWEDSAGLG